jgi:hypothetical protein
VRRAAALASLLGCVSGGEPAALPEPDRALFEAVAEPVLVARCASLACHGTERRRLRVFAPERLREDPRRSHLLEPLTAREHALNYHSARAFSEGAPSAAQSLLVLKPLGLAGHLGGAVFTTAEDPECDALLRWLRSGALP